jgi:hypothetical protein
MTVGNWMGSFAWRGEIELGRWETVTLTYEAEEARE